VVNPTTGLGLPPAPPLPPEVRERVRRALLHEIDAMPTPVPTPARHLRWAPLLTAAAVALVAVVVAAAVALSGVHPDGPGPATGPSAGTAPLPESQHPAPTGEALRDAALLRCAAAVVRSGRAGEYPPTGTWTSSPLIAHQTPLEFELVIDDSFGCLLTPTTVVVTGTTGTPLGGVQVVRLTAGELVLLNPQDRRFTIGPRQQVRPDGTGPLMFYRLDPGVSLGDLRLTVAGENGYSGPIPEPVAALTVVDRPLPTRPAGAPDGAELADCLGSISDFDVHPDLWMPVGRHDVGGTAPRALVARISDVAAGFCIQDPTAGPTFTFGPLPAPGDRPALVVPYDGGASAALVTAPPGVTRVVVSPRTGSAGANDCTIMDGLAMCTFDDPAGQHALTGQPIVVTAFTAAHPQGIEVYRG
jgi:hypothetical protein